MEKITVLGNYNVYIGSGILTRFSKLLYLKNYSNLVVITDKSVAKYWLKKLEKIIPGNLGKIVLQQGEKSKNIKTVKKIWQKFLINGCDRKTLVLNLGGGAILDVGGFAASTFMRGVDFINIPTTLLSQVDASVGGKTGIDFANIKNLIGTFHQPKAVIIDITTLSTLPKREFLSGFSEIIKHGLIKNRKYFEKVISKHPLEFTDNELIDIISESVQIKTNIVQNDETEKGCRKLLNFGHTIGHAIEALSLETSTPLLHGEAISIGMLAEAYITHLVKMISSSDLQRIKQSLTNAGLPVSIAISTDKIISRMRSDKKNESGNINFTLLQAIGKAIINQNVPHAVIIQALKRITE